MSTDDIIGMSLRDVRAVLFDLDGTVATFNIDYERARRKAIEEIRARGLDESGATEEFSIYVMLKRLKLSMKEAAFRSLQAKLYAFLEDVELEAAEHVELINGARDILKELVDRGLKLGLVTNNGTRGAKMTMRKLGLSKFFDTVVTRDDSYEMKPDGGSIRCALQRLRENPSSAIYVGDSQMDILAARAAGVTSVAVPSGPFSLERLLDAEPDFLIGSLQELPVVVVGDSNRWPAGKTRMSIATGQPQL